MMGLEFNSKWFALLLDLQCRYTALDSSSSQNGLLAGQSPQWNILWFENQVVLKSHIKTRMLSHKIIWNMF